MDSQFPISKILSSEFHSSNLIQLKPSPSHLLAIFLPGAQSQIVGTILESSFLSQHILPISKSIHSFFKTYGGTQTISYHPHSAHVGANVIQSLAYRNRLLSHFFPATPDFIPHIFTKEQSLQNV